MDEMGKIFRQVDFTRGQKGLKERIWQCVEKKTFSSLEQEVRELADEELEDLAAAGSEKAIPWQPDDEGKG